MSVSFARAALPLSAALLLLTAGCFRQSGEIIKPTGTADGQVAITRPPAASVSPAPAAVTLASTPGLEIHATSTPAPLATSLPAGATLTPAATVVFDLATPTSHYITPQIPLGFTTPDTPAPTMAAVPETTGLARTPGTPPSFILPDSSDILATPTNLPGVDDPCIHVIQPGDSLYLIAITYGFTVSNILAANPDLGGASAVIQPGDPIYLPLPDCDLPEVTAEPGSTRSTQTAVPAPPPSATSAAPAGSQTYIVRSGDVLVNIATRFGVTVNAIVQANNLSNPNALQVGQTLIIPASR